MFVLARAIAWGPLTAWLTAVGNALGMFAPSFITGHLISRFGTLNVMLAGAVLLLLPGALVAVWELARCLQNVTRGVLVGLVGYMGVACLYWSGSKAGWLIALMYHQLKKMQ